MSLTWRYFLDKKHITKFRIYVAYSIASWNTAKLFLGILVRKRKKKKTVDYSSHEENMQQNVIVWLKITTGKKNWKLNIQNLGERNHSYPRFSFGVSFTIKPRKTVWERKKMTAKFINTFTIKITFKSIMYCSYFLLLSLMSILFFHFRKFIVFGKNILFCAVQMKFTPTLLSQIVS